MGAQDRLAALQDARSQALLDMQRMFDRAEGENRAFDADEQKRFDELKAEVARLDQESRRVYLEATKDLVPVSRAFAGMDFDDPGSASPKPRAAMVGPAGLVDVSGLHRAFERSESRVVGRTELPMSLRTLVQGGSAGQLGRTRMEDAATVEGTYGALPLVFAVQVIPCDAGTYWYNRVKPVSAPATGGVQATEGAAKTQVALEAVPSSLVLATHNAYEKISLQALQDQSGIAAAVESILFGAVFRSADAAAWTAILAASTPSVPETDVVATILKSAAKVADAGGMGIRVVMSPLDYVNMMLVKATTAGSWMGLPPGIAMPPILQSSGIPSGKVLVTAGTDGAFCAMRSSVVSAIGVDADDFTKNLRTVLVEGRMASGVRNPAFSIAGDLKSA